MVELPTSFLDLLNENIQVNKKFSFSIWLQITNEYSQSNGQGTILCVLNNTSFDGHNTVGMSIGSYSPNNILMFLVNYNIGLTQISITKNLSVGIHHFCFVFNSLSVQSVYIDGVLENSTPIVIGTVGTINYAGLSKNIGGYLSPAFNLIGILYDLKIFNIDLQALDVEKLYQKKLTSKAKKALIFNMPFEQKEGFLAQELVAGNNGTLIGYPIEKVSLGSENSWRDAEGNPILS